MKKYQMVREFHIGKETDIGYYVSLITSSFAISQLASGKIGKKDNGEKMFVHEDNGLHIIYLCM